MLKEIIKKRFFFARHGETDWNSRHLCQGQQDIPLNEKGILEAQRLVSESRHLDIPCIVSSSLMRAIQTAKAIQEAHPRATFHVVPELAERCWGGLEGMPSEEMYAIEKLEEQNPLYIVQHGAESRVNFHRRVRYGMSLAQSYHDHPFIVSHGRVFLELCFILGLPPIRQIPSCKIFEIVPVSNKWVLNQ
ncbi:MAG: histidine phosphatase family protein [Parachlamydiales bacterium]|nr:histidine phosphatase family protein [Parachlamydiales bacterium]